MKILYYNWIQFDKKNNSGGGVSVYQKNLIEYLANNDTNEIYFLSSGIYYDIFRKDTYICKTKNIFKENCKTFKIVNSASTAPFKAMYDEIDTYLNDETTYIILKEFIQQYGEFDVIHFNNIEGLSSKCLEIKKDFPNTKVIYSIHNYCLFCPQINLFFNNMSNCLDYENGTKCCKCLDASVSKRKFITFYKIDGLFEKLHLYNLSDKIKLISKKANKRLMRKKNYNENNNKLKNSEIYLKYRKSNIFRINTYFDTVLAVSTRVKEIAINMGINSGKIYTNYIGTEFAKNSLDYANFDIQNEYLTIAYMGYFDKMKGYDFLISALENLPEELSKKIKFVCYAKIKNSEDEQKVERINRLRERLHSVNHYNGYSHRELPQILSKINLGVIPVIWEDNLPQVAIEYVAHGVPILCSDLGGAQELSSSEYFVFKSGDMQDFINKLEMIINNKQLLNEYFKNKKKLTTMDEHMKELLYFYGQE